MTDEPSLNTRSPVHAIPVEILGEIFLQYLPVYPVCPPILGDASPAKLGQICSHWRNIAHSMPSLWRAVALMHCGAPPAAKEAELEMAGVWLQRSAPQPVAVALDVRLFKDEHRTPALELLLAHCERWEHGYLNLHNLDFAAVRKLLRSKLPLLRQLEVRLLRHANAEGTELPHPL
ncbi:F-box domain-containing protein [Mycena kentingensis (nom. inval.)]|nr:F-box domain-containing protein [Mycena kentingensis (nom. inval.)]